MDTSSSELKVAIAVVRVFWEGPFLCLLVCLCCILLLVLVCCGLFAPYALKNTSFSMKGVCYADYVSLEWREWCPLLLLPDYTFLDLLLTNVWTAELGFG